MNKLVSTKSRRKNKIQDLLHLYGRRMRKSVEKTKLRAHRMAYEEEQEICGTKEQRCNGSVSRKLVNPERERKTEGHELR
jgi:hypothetical protein